MMRSFLSVPALLLVVLSGTTAHATSKDLIHIRVLSSHETSYFGQPAVQKDCGWRDISAYCTNSAPQLYHDENLEVQSDLGQTERIRCTVFDKWSHCVSLPVGETFEAKPVKNALIIRYTDSEGKQQKQKYEIVSSRSK